MSFVSHITGARQAARIASVEARGEQLLNGTPDGLVDGVVTAVTGENYTVDVLGDDGEVVATYERIYPWPSATLEVGQGVKLAFSSYPGDDPTIVTGGGSGGGTSCCSSFLSWAVLP